MKLLLFLLPLFLLPIFVTAQSNVDIEQLIEEYGLNEENVSYEDVVQRLVSISESPMNINRINFDSLKMLSFLSDSQIDNILTFRDNHGKYGHLRELLLVSGISKTDFDYLSHFLYVGESKKSLNLKLNPDKSEYILRLRTNLPKSEGYKKYSIEDFKSQAAYEKKLRSRFMGKPFAMLFRAKIDINKNVSAGVTCENDAGERYFTKYQKWGFDYLSLWASYVNQDTKLRKLVVGNYRAQFGQGLLIWGGFSSGKSSSVLGMEKPLGGFSAHSSSDEVNYLRGVALTMVPIKNLTTNVFASYRKTDGNVLRLDTLTDDDILTASIDETGYHRSLTECEKKNKLKETTLGGNVSWNTKYFRLGGNALYYNFSPSLGVGDEVYKQYNDDGKRRLIFSVDYKTGYKKLVFFGETAIGKSIATINGLRWSRQKLSLGTLFRYYDKKFNSHYAGAFGEYSDNTNEQGFYFALSYTPNKALKINGYFDYFTFFSPRYRALNPGPGYEYLLETVWSHSKYQHLFRYKFERRAEDVNGQAGCRDKGEFRYQFTATLSKRFELRTRGSLSHYSKDGDNEYGFLVSQDVIYTSGNGKMKAQCRLAYFDIDSYNTRIYAYENNVLYGYSFPSFMYRGWRTYLNMNVKTSNRVSLYVKAGYTVYPDMDTLSSGTSLIDSNYKTDFSIQIRVKL